jgi:hypothetical protein
MKAAPPPEIVDLARARAAAREAHDWPEADRLRVEIEAAGWKVVDRGMSFHLAPAHAADVVEDDRIRYGRSVSIPSRLDEAPTAFATVVLLATDCPEDVARALSGLRAHAPAGTQVVVVAEAPSAEQEAALLDANGPVAAPIGGIAPEVVWTSERLGHAAAFNAGLRRSAGPVAILLDMSVEPTGDVVTPLVRALDDPSIAVVGGWGFASDDLRTFADAAPGDVVAIEGPCQAVRCRDYVSRGPLDEHFRFQRYLDIWWSLVLRDEGEGTAPRRAVRLDGLPVERHELRGFTRLTPAERARRSRRNFYRIIDRFGWRRDLLLAAGPGSEATRR